MISLHLLLIVLALICFLLAAAGVNSKIGLIPLGLAFWILTLLLT